jgi:hypothetical protein
MGCLLGCVEAASRFNKQDDSEGSRLKELVTT